MSLNFPLNFRDPSCIDPSNVLGFILNVPTEYKFGFIVFPLKRRHWIAVRRVGNKYWNLDSKLDSPQEIGDVSIQIEIIALTLISLITNNSRKQI